MSVFVDPLAVMLIVRRLKNGLANDGILLTRYVNVSPRSRKAYSEIERAAKIPVNARKVAAFVT